MNLLEKIKDLLDNTKDNKSGSENFEVQNGEQTPATVAEDEKFVEVKTTDDSILRVDGELEEGKSIEVIDETGASTAPNGEYEIEDGTVIVVEEGIIASITSPDTNIEDVEGEPSAGEGDMAGEEDEDEDKVKLKADEKFSTSASTEENILESFKVLIGEVNELKNSISDIETLKTELKEMNEDFSKFKKSPSSKSINEDKPSKEWGTLYSKFGKHRR
jgi:hypothetical protein